MLKTIALVAVIAIAAVLIVAAMKPDNFVVQRSININAAPEKIYPLIGDFHNWTQWSPYEKLDPNLQRSYSGAPAGIGAVYEWNGDKNVGKGRMQIIDAKEPHAIIIQLDFIEPFAAHNTAEFTLTPHTNTTTVTWSMRGPSPFISKIMQVFFSMDKMVGTDFETGLANLKTIAER